MSTLSGLPITAVVSARAAPPQNRNPSVLVGSSKDYTVTLGYKDILSKMPEVHMEKIRRWITYINGSENYVLQSELINAICVLAGLKPVLAIMKNSPLHPFCEKNHTWGNGIKLLRFEDASGGGYFLINEHPLPEFDPRKFIDQFEKKYESIEAAVMHAFPDLGNQETSIESEQLLSYLLGYGPTWEAYRGVSWLWHMNGGAADDHVKETWFKGANVFSEEHFLQLGTALSQNRNLSREALIQNGKNYHANAKNQNWTPPDAQANWKNKMNKLCMHHQADPISYQTEYIQNGTRYREAIFELFGIKPLFLPHTFSPDSSLSLQESTVTAIATAALAYGVYYLWASIL